MSSLFLQQLAIYSRYHRDPRNRATHFIGIPAIVFSLLLPLALWRFRLFGLDISAAYVAAFVALVGWIALDAAIGIAMAAIVLPMLLVAEAIAGSYGAPATWIVFAIFFVGGWAFQLAGHIFEGKRPAFLDNLFQAFVGPMFLMAEVLIALGLKRELKHLIDGSAPPIG